MKTNGTTRSKEISDLLCNEILQGQYRPGERLPSERDLASRFDTNRGTVREALKMLEQLGIAAIHPGGVRVIPIEDATLDVLGHMMALDELPDRNLVNQMLDVSAALMALSIKSAVERATDEQIVQIRLIVAQIQESACDIAQSRQDWKALGEYFNEINGNLVLRLIGNGLKAQFVGRMEAIGSQVQLDALESQRILKELDSAISDRDPERSAASALAHFGLVRQRINEILSSTPGLDSAVGAR